jgi:small subunit ribosomal protein S17
MADKTTGTKGPRHTPATEKPRGRRKTAIGYVVSDKMDKTIVVEIESRAQHPKYGKIIRTTKKVKAHDEEGTAGIGDRAEDRRRHLPVHGAMFHVERQPVPAAASQEPCRQRASQ